MSNLMFFLLYLDDTNIPSKYNQFYPILSTNFNFKYTKPKSFFSEPNDKYAYILEVKFNTNLYDSQKGESGDLDPKDY